MPASKPHGIPHNSDRSEPYTRNNNANNTHDPSEQQQLLLILKTVCDQHGLPLGQTWSPCSQQPTKHTINTQCWASEKPPHPCISVVESACYVRDQGVLGFHQACSEHHLRQGQGVVGSAMLTDQPICFATDLTGYSKVEYPLSHHAKMFGISGSIAMHIKGKGGRNRNYVLELLLLPPVVDHDGLDFYWRVVESLSMAVRSSHSFHLVEGEREDGGRGVTTTHSHQQQRQPVQEEITFFPSKEVSSSSSSLCLNDDNLQKQYSGASEWEKKGVIPNLMVHQQQHKEGKDNEVVVTTSLTKSGSWNFDHGHDQDTDYARRGIIMFFDDKETRSSSNNNNKVVEFGSNATGYGSSDGSYATKSSSHEGGNGKRKPKAQKTISMQILKQYFAGSLKDAARDIGVCPTTLKRICRQHGINRWPSRKIKKVGHSLKKLQRVMDSIQGAQGSVQLSSFYFSFPGAAAGAATSVPGQQQQKNPPSLPESTSFTTSRDKTSPSSSSASSQSFSKQPSPVAAPNSSANSARRHTINMEDARTKKELMTRKRQLPSTTSLLNIIPSSEQTTITNRSGPVSPGKNFCTVSKDKEQRRVLLKVKATFGEDKIRFTLLPNMGFVSLQHEIAKRFGMTDLSRVHIKYMDDDIEWVLLTCEEDLYECVNIHAESGSFELLVQYQGYGHGGCCWVGLPGK